MSIFAPPPMQRIEHADAFVSRTGARIIESGTVPGYDLHNDTIHMPNHIHFKDSYEMPKAQSYYRALFHELGHFTGHPDRLGREMGEDPFGYAYEELIADTVAYHLCHKLNVAKPNAEYMQYYLKDIGGDFAVVDRAIAEGKVAADYLLYLADM